MTTGYNIACALHPSLVSISFYAIPISLSIIHRIFLFTSYMCVVTGTCHVVSKQPIMCGHRPMDSNPNVSWRIFCTISARCSLQESMVILTHSNGHLSCVFDLTTAGTEQM